MRVKNGIRITAAAVAATCVLGGCSVDWEHLIRDDAPIEPEHSVSAGIEEDSEAPLAESSEEKSEISWAESSDSMQEYRYSLKNTLSEKQTELYNRFTVMIEELETEFVFENEAEDDVKTAYYAVLDDHPEYFWLGKSFTYQMKTLGEQSEITVSPTLFSDDDDEIIKAQKELESIVSDIVNEAASKENTYEKILYVHDYIINNTVYDTETLALIKAEENEGLLNASTAYGCLVENTAICSGYSTAFQLIMHRLGIECGKVNGTRASESGSHQWNYVCVDGEYYFIDLTWDDPIKDDGENTKTYEYFLISYDDMKNTHTIDGTMPVPDETGTKYNYYVYNGLYFEDYDFSYVQDAAEWYYADGGLSVKFSSPEVLDEAMNELIVEQKVFDIDRINDGISYSVSTSGCILSIYY